MNKIKLKNNRKISSDCSLNGWFFQQNPDIIFSYTTLSLDRIKSISNFMRESKLIFEIGINSTGISTKKIHSTKRKTKSGIHAPIKNSRKRICFDIASYRRDNRMFEKIRTMSYEGIVTKNRIYTTSSIDNRLSQSIILIFIDLHSTIIKNRYRRIDRKSLSLIPSLQRSRKRNIIIDTITIRITVNTDITITKICRTYSSKFIIHLRR